MQLNLSSHDGFQSAEKHITFMHLKMSDFPERPNQATLSVFDKRPCDLLCGLVAMKCTSVIYSCTLSSVEWGGSV